MDSLGPLHKSGLCRTEGADLYNPFKMIGLFNEVLQKGCRVKLALFLCSCTLRCLMSEVQSLRIESGPFKKKLERPESLS